jgi:hypothetical protein
VALGSGIGAAARNAAGRFAGAAQPPAGPPPNPNAAATAADHQNMMEQLGITKLRPGPSGTESRPTTPTTTRRWRIRIPTCPRS